jgi:hypothetical protein
LAKIVQLVVIAVGVFLLWAYGVPWAKRLVGDSRAPVSDRAPGPNGYCVQMAARASQQMSDQALSASRGLMDDTQWRGILDEVSNALSDAENECGCEQESCGLARQALSSLRSVLGSLEGSNPGGSQSVPYDAKRTQEKANQTLWEAHALALKGS